MDFGLGEFYQMLEKYFGPKAAKVFTAIVAVAVTGFCIKIIFDDILVPIYGVTGYLLSSFKSFSPVEIKPIEITYRDVVREIIRAIVAGIGVLIIYTTANNVVNLIFARYTWRKIEKVRPMIVASARKGIKEYKKSLALLRKSKKFNAETKKLLERAKRYYQTAKTRNDRGNERAKAILGQARKALEEAERKSKNSRR
jgi:hypothetical protein